MELRHLRYFVAVAEELHFGRAAERLGIAQPPLSQQIKSLEGEMGVRLFLRTKRSVELTSAGSFFYGEARKILSLSEQALHSTRRVSRGEVGQLVVGFVNSAISGKFPSIFRKMRQRYPDVSLVLHDLTSEEQVEAMTANRLDVGLVRPPIIAPPDISIQVVWREKFVVALPRGHRLAKLPQIPMKALADESFLQVPRNLGPGFYDQFIQLCAHAGFTPKVVQEARSTQTIVSLVSSGIGISIVPESLESFQRAGVVYRPLKSPSISTYLAVMWKTHDTSPALHSFLNIIHETLHPKGL